MRVACSSSWKYSRRAPSIPFLEQPFPSVLETLPVLLDAQPALQHPVYLGIHLVDPLHKSITRIQVLGDARNMGAEVRFLAVRDGAVHETSHKNALMLEALESWGASRVRAPATLGQVCFQRRFPSKIVSRSAQE